MEFKDGVLVDRELEIARYLRHEFPMVRILKRTGMKKKILEGHVKNMREKFHAEDDAALIRMIQTLPKGLQTSSTDLEKIRAATNVYFKSANEKAGNVGNRNIVLIAIVLLLGIAAILLAYDCLMELFLKSGFADQYKGLFAG